MRAAPWHANRLPIGFLGTNILALYVYSSACNSVFAEKSLSGDSAG
jgi:hypothetical protein